MITIQQVPVSHLIPTKCHNKWFVHRDIPYGYLHTDGSWQTACVGLFWNTTGYFDTKEEAEEVLKNAHPQTNTEQV